MANTLGSGQDKDKKLATNTNRFKQKLDCPLYFITDHFTFKDYCIAQDSLIRTILIYDVFSVSNEELVSAISRDL